MPSCIPKELPQDQRIEAAFTACQRNPANRPNTNFMFAGFEPTPQRLAVMTTKYWGAKGVTLTVGFMDGAPADLRSRILAHMNAWGNYCNAHFVLTQVDPQVRIARDLDGYWSYLGTDILHIPKNRATMNLEGFTMQTPQSEFIRVVRHETGHCLGFPHEHMRAEIIQRLDPQKTIAYFAQTQGWTPAMTTANVLTPLSESSLIATPHADSTSIMTYQLPGSITRDGRPIPGGDDIDEQDKAFCAKIYPLAIIPPVEPPTPPPPPVKPPEPPTVPSTLKDVIDAIFKALEAQLSGKPMLILIVKTIHALVLQWLEQNPAQAQAPAPSNASQLQTIVDQIFAALAEQFAGNFWMTMLIQTVQTLVNQLLSDPAKAAAVIRTGSYGVST